MESAKYIGRVGGLAVTLGIGAAITLGPGLAWAETDGSDGGNDANSTSQQDSSGGDAGTGQQTSDSQSASNSRAGGPLSKIAERARKNLDNAVDRVRDRSKLSQIRGSDDNRIVQILRRKDEDQAEDQVEVQDEAEDPDQQAVPEAVPEVVPEVDVSTSDAGTGPFQSIRSTLQNTIADEPIRSANRSEKLTALQPEPAATLPDLTPVKRASTVVVRITEAAETVAQRGTEAISEVAANLSAVAPTAASASFVPTLTTSPPTESVATVPRLVSSVLAALGLGPLAGNGPIAPTQSPVLLAMLAWATRRESQRSVDPTEASVLSVADVTPTAAVVVDPNQLTPQPDAPVVGDTQKLDWVTGEGITDFPSGTPGGYGIAGTDLGIPWDNHLTGDQNAVLMIFGDTFDQPQMTGVWRSNVLLRSFDDNLADGNLDIDSAVYSDGGIYGPDTNDWSNLFGATQVIRDPGFLGLFGSTTTIIPTAAIAVTEKDANGEPVIGEDGQPVVTHYVTVMSVRTWDTPGRWTTNWSAIAYSEDGGKTWTVDPNTVRSSGWLRSSTPYVPGNQNFQQNALVMGPEDDPNSYTEDGRRYVYVYGTPSGRGGSAYLARVPEDQIRDLDAYEYWAGESRGGWVADDPSMAVPVIGATDQGPPPSGFIGLLTKAITDFLGGIVVGGNVSEMSVQYNEYLDQYVVLYTDGDNNVVMRVSDSPQGEWSEPTVLVANNPLLGNTGMYAPMIHPWSGTDKLGEDNEHILYYNLSYWGDYNVRLMQTDLSPMGPAAETAGTIEV